MAHCPPLPPPPKGDSLSLSPLPQNTALEASTEPLPSCSIKQTVPLTAVGKTGREAVPGDPGRARLLLGAALVGGPGSGSGAAAAAGAGPGGQLRGCCKSDQRRPCQFPPLLVWMLSAQAVLSCQAG